LAYDDLRDWIRTLEDHGELKRIRQEVSPELEITEITTASPKSARGRRCGRRYSPGGPRCSLKT